MIIQPIIAQVSKTGTSWGEINIVSGQAYRIRIQNRDVNGLNVNMTGKPVALLLRRDEYSTKNTAVISSPTYVTVDSVLSHIINVNLPSNITSAFSGRYFVEYGYLLGDNRVYRTGYGNWEFSSSQISQSLADNYVPPSLMKDPQDIYAIVEPMAHTAIDAYLPTAADTYLSTAVPPLVDAAAQPYVDLSQAWAEGTLPGGTGTQSSREYSEDAEAVVVVVTQLKTDVEDIVQNFETVTAPGAVSDVNVAKDAAIVDVNLARDAALTAVGDSETQAITNINDTADAAIITINGLVTQAETARDAAEGHSTQAGTHATNASGSATAAGESAVLSQDWAEGTLPGGAGTKSSKEHADESEVFANTFLKSATVAYINTVEAADGWVHDRWGTDGAIRKAMGEGIYEHIAFWTDRTMFGRNFVGDTGDVEVLWSQVEAARDASVAAKTGSETAHGLSEFARGKSEEAQAAAEAAQELAEGAQTGAETAQGLAEGAQTAAETAQGKSEDWAEGTLPGGAGTKSSKEHAEDSQTHANEYLTAETIAYTGVVEAASGWVRNRWETDEAIREAKGLGVFSSIAFWTNTEVFGRNFFLSS